MNVKRVVEFLLKYSYQIFHLESGLSRVSMDTMRDAKEGHIYCISGVAE